MRTRREFGYLTRRLRTVVSRHITVSDEYSKRTLRNSTTFDSKISINFATDAAHRP